MRYAALLLAGFMAAASAPLALAEPPPASAGAPPPAASAKFKDPEAQASYAIGVNLGSGLRRQQIAVDPEILAEGVKDALGGGPTQMNDDQIRAVLARLQQQVQAHQAQLKAAAAETNKSAGAAFLKANAARAGVVTLPSGLQYQVLTAGAGPKPKLSNTVICNYRGVLIDGTEFDSSANHGGPASFSVGGVIAGWTEALQLMPVGSKWRVFVPSALAYGENGAGSTIGPNSVLIFEIELLSIAG